MANKTYLLTAPIDGGGFKVLNAIAWDEQQPYTPPDGHSVVVKLGDEWIGWTSDGAGNWAPPPDPEA